MRLFFNKKLFKKLLIIFLVMNIIMNMIAPNSTLGAWDITGAILVKPVASLVMVVIDAVNIILQIFLGGLNTFAEDNKANLEWADESFFASPEKIFAGEYPILNANLFYAKSINKVFNYSAGGAVDELLEGAGANAISNLKSAVAGIYILLRNLAAVILLCLLIYTGIRIVLSARSPEEQSKWRGYLYDWLKALILLIFMHLIMITIFNVTDILANALAENLGDNQSITSKIRGTIKESLGSVELITATILYIYTTYLTVVFTFAYFRRVLWTSILIIMAPNVAAIYATGNEGKNIYQRWFREFLMNCLIQPYHVITYYVLVMLPLNMSGK